MLNIKKCVATGVICIMALTGCGGGDGTPAAGGAGGTPTTGAGTVSGTAGSGSPIVGGTITITDSTTPTPQTRTATTNTDGTYTVNNTDTLTFPLRIEVSFAEGGAISTLRSIAVSENEDGTTRANINPLTDVIAGSVEGINDVTTLNSEIARLAAVLAAILSNYGIDGDSDFIGGMYTADPTVDPVDNALDMVSVRLDDSGNNIILQSTADPSINQTVPVENTQPEDVMMNALPAPAETASASPSDIKALVDSFAAALALGENLTDAGLNGVLHEDYKDDDGFTKAQFAELVAEEAQADGLEINVTGYKILRCFADSGSITDKCYIRVTFTSPTLEGEDFGGSPGAEISSDFIDLIAERRNGGDLKFAGGFFKPYSATIKLFNSNTVSVNNNGVATVGSSVSKGLSIFARVASPGQTPFEPEQVANTNLKTIALLRVSGDSETVLMTVTRSVNNQCEGSNNRLNRNPAEGGCGNQSFDESVSNVAADSAEGALTAVFIDINDNEFDVPNVRVVDPTSSDIASFGTLNQTSLQNLTTYANGSGAGSVSITLTPPAGADFICISDGGNNEDICTYASRTVTITTDQLNRQSNYFILTRDAEKNTFQRQYILNQISAPAIQAQ
jgi:hypothetical protein